MIRHLFTHHPIYLLPTGESAVVVNFGSKILLQICSESFFRCDPVPTNSTITALPMQLAPPVTKIPMVKSDFFGLVQNGWKTRKSTLAGHGSLVQDAP